MAILKGRTGSGKGLALGGKLLITVNRGQLIASSWPKKRGKPTSQVTLDQNEWFRQANYLAKYADGQSQWMAIRLTKGGPLYPRDILMSAMKGRLFERLLVDGEEWTAVAVRDDVSSDLDLLAGSDLGTILVRGPDTWQALLPGSTGNVLTSNGLDAQPTYQPAGAASGHFYIQSGANTTLSGGAFATKGYIFQASRAFTVFAIAMRVNGVSGQTYIGRVIEVNASQVIAAITGSTPEITLSTTAAQLVEATFAVPISIEAERYYCVVWSRTDGSDTSVNGAYHAPLTDGVDGLPMVPMAIATDNDVTCWIARVTPTIGETLTIGASSKRFSAMELAIS